MSGAEVFDILYPACVVWNFVSMFVIDDVREWPKFFKLCLVLSGPFWVAFCLGYLFLMILCAVFWPRGYRYMTFNPEERAYRDRLEEQRKARRAEQKARKLLNGH